MDTGRRQVTDTLLHSSVLLRVVSRTVSQQVFSVLTLFFLVVDVVTTVYNDDKDPTGP